MSDESDSNAPAKEREALLKELKRRLAEIEALKHQLGISTPPEPEGPDQNANSTEKIRASLEEIVVPPLEMLDDTPHPKKKKPAPENTA